MEKKLKFSEFAELIGTTAKTVYKMEEREEIVTVTEKVNNRPTRLVVTNDEQIQYFRGVYRKAPVNNFHYEDMLTENEIQMNGNNSPQINENGETIKEMFDKIIEVNKEYNNHIQKLNEELIDSKSKLLLLEDKAKREGLYLNEINELKTLNRGLKKWLLISITTLIVVLFTVLIGSITYNILSIPGNESEGQKKEQVIQEVQTKVEPPAQPAYNKKVPNGKK